MPTFSTLDRADIELTASSKEDEARVRTEVRRRFLVLGDFSGRESRGVAETRDLGVQRQPIRVDREDLDEVLARLQPEIRVASGQSDPFLIRPRSLDDFHPDRLLARESVFSDLRRVLAGLDDPTAFDEAARIVRGWDARETPVAAQRQASPPREIGAAAGGDVLEEMLTADRRKSPPGSRDPELDRLVAGIVRPHVDAGEPADRGRLKVRAEQEVGHSMRQLLHAPAFQAAEAAWRGLDFLLRTLEIGDETRVDLLDVTKEELAADLKAASDLAETGVQRILSGGADGSARFSAAVCLYEFGPTVEDVALLARLARIGSAVGTPLLSAAAPALLASDRLDRAPDPKRWIKAKGQPAEELWAALRLMPEARYLGLAAPRFLLRLPYGKRTDEAETFAFEEFEAAPVHSHYLWGNPALLCLIANESPGPVSGLPLYVYAEAGESRIQPGAETLLPPPVAEAMLERGIMPVMAFPDRDSVRVARMQSVADPPTPLGAHEG